MQRALIHTLSLTLCLAGFCAPLLGQGLGTGPALTNGDRGLSAAPEGPGGPLDAPSPFSPVGELDIGMGAVDVWSVSQVLVRPADDGVPQGPAVVGNLEVVVDSGPDTAFLLAAMHQGTPIASVRVTVGPFGSPAFQWDLTAAFVTGMAMAADAGIAPGDPTRVAVCFQIEAVTWTHVGTSGQTDWDVTLSQGGGPPLPDPVELVVGAPGTGGWVPITSVSQEMSAGGMAAQHEDLEITRASDALTLAFLAACLTGTSAPQVVVEHREDGGVVRLRTELKTAIVSRIELATTKTGALVESVSFDYDSIDWFLEDGVFAFGFDP